MPDIYVKAEVSLSTQLKDLRPFSYGAKFGTVEQVCKQYGIKHETKDNYIVFHAPKSRLIYFVEKLHFAGCIYGEIREPKKCK